FFFFQAGDGIRDFHVTGVQTCALPIYQGFEAELSSLPGKYAPPAGELLLARGHNSHIHGCIAFRALDTSGRCEMKRLYVAESGQIGRASCRERVERSEDAGPGWKDGGK